MDHPALTHRHSLAGMANSRKTSAAILENNLGDLGRATMASQSIDMGYAGQSPDAEGAERGLAS